MLQGPLYMPYCAYRHCNSKDWITQSISWIRQPVTNSVLKLWAKGSYSGYYTRIPEVPLFPGHLSFPVCGILFPVGMSKFRPFPVGRKFGSHPGLGHWKRHWLLLYRPYAITASWHQYRYRKLCRPGKYISATKIFTIRKSIPSVRNMTTLSRKMSDPSYTEPEWEISGRRCAGIPAHAGTLAPMTYMLAFQRIIFPRSDFT